MIYDALQLIFITPHCIHISKLRARISACIYVSTLPFLSMVKTVRKVEADGTRKTTMSSSASSSASASSNGKNKYKGVRMRSWGSWVSEIRAPNQKTRIWLGSYSTAEAAARAYDAALICLKGSSVSSATNLNFPLSHSHYLNIIPNHSTALMSPKSIQRVAAAVANSTPPTTNESSLFFSPTTPSSASPALSMSSDHQFDDDDDDAPLVAPCYDDQPLNTDYGICNNGSMMTTAAPDCWFDHQYNTTTSSFDGCCFDESPKYADLLMFNTTTTAAAAAADSLFNPPALMDHEHDYFYDEEVDIPLWSFC